MPVHQPPDRSDPSAPSIAQAAAHADMGTIIDGDARLKGLKKAALRVLRLITNDQVAFNRQAVAALQALASELERSSTSAAQREADAQAELVGTQDEVRVLRRLVDDDIRAELSSLARDRQRDHDELVGLLESERAQRAGAEHQIAELATQLHELRTDLLVQRSRVDLFLREARQRLPGDFDQHQLESFAGQIPQRLDELLSDLASPFRGQFEEIKVRLQAHLGAVNHLAQGTLPAVDLGTGRGEWLTLLAEHDIPAYGIDLNSEVVDSSRSRGLDVRSGDFVAHLEELAEGSVGAVTGFHIIEHVDFVQQVALIDASLHALAPGGLLLLETPNPTNLIVGASSFYLDPTHQRPAHPELLRFLVEQRGFVDVEVTFIHPATEHALRVPEDAPESAALKPIISRLNELLYGPQDYTVMAWKAPGRPNSSPKPQTDAS